MRAGLGYVIDVEAGVHFKNSCVKSVEHIASAILRAVRIDQGGERFLRRWEFEVCVQERGVVARVLAIAHGIKKGFVKIEEVLPELKIRQKNNLLLDRSVSNNRVVDRDTCEVEVFLVVRMNEAIRNVGNVISMNL